MVGNRHQRRGADAFGGEAAGAPGSGAASGAMPRRAWARMLRSDVDIRQGGIANPSSQGHVNGLQAGTDLLAGPGWEAGVYVGQTQGHARVDGFAHGMQGRVGQSELRSQYLALYGSWQSSSGFYADAVLQAARHRNDTRASDSGTPTQLKGKGLLASLEVGQRIDLGSGWQVEPQLQLMHQRLSVDDVALQGQTAVRHDNDSAWTVRAGLRVQGAVATTTGRLQLYGRANLYHRSRGTDVARFIGPVEVADAATHTGGSSAELAAGADWQLGRRWSLYGEVGKLWATGGPQRTGGGVQGSVGMKARW